MSEKLNPIRAWHIATALKLHFDGSYDAQKYNFKMSSLKPSNFEGRRDRYFFERAARNHSTQDEFIWFCAANIINGRTWIGDMTDEAYNELTAWHESMSYKFEQELKSIIARYSDLDNMLEATHRIKEIRPPAILVAYSNRDISIHTIAIIQCLTGFLDKEMKNVSDPLGMWNSDATKIIKYASLLKPKLNLEKMKSIVISSFTSK